MVDKSIQIRNVYYMLSYAFNVLMQDKYSKIETERFENVADLFAEILFRGISQQIKQGLYREYIDVEENLPVLRGKLDINGTVKNRVERKVALACSYDELSEDNLFNRIIKATVLLLIRSEKVKAARKKQLKKILICFSAVDNIDIFSIKWDILKFRKNNQSYKMLINICYFTVKGLLYSERNGKYKMADFLDEQRMCRLYEKFILEYYRYHYKNQKVKATASFIEWAAEGEAAYFLPAMKSDVMLEYQNKTLIIDAKYYARNMQIQYSKSTFHSHNLYQIFTYVKNYNVNKKGNDVSGMLLYAKTDEEIQPDGDFMMSGNRISIKTLDLNTPFSEIRERLDYIISEYLINRN
ncbi:MAG: 5-methylcytosine-specific restriction endonuclease system specificity protein McrC [Clostridia bacterium]|nr:5-methylcytosine-specific restriction endonuclease system specificity protein McrC [Clostridia bacterium]